MTDARATYGVNVADGQYHANPQNVIWYVALNTSRAPFNNANLRKAVNYAVDRTAMSLQQGAYASTPTDQILPPGIPGYHDAQIYPLNAPDYNTAQTLAGNSCGTVKLWSFTTTFGPSWANSVKSSLEQIGCTVVVTLLDRVSEVTMAGVKGADFDAMINGRGQDYTDPFNVLDILLNGNNIQDSNNLNFSYFNNPDINTKLGLANPLTGDARYQTYGDLDIEIMTGHAPIVPIVDTNAREFNSARLGGYVLQPSFGRADLNTFFVK